MQNNANFIVFEKEAYYNVLNEFLKIAKETVRKENLSVWMSEEEAMNMLGVSSKSTMQKFRDEDRIIYSMVTAKNIRYNRESILNYIEQKSNRSK